MTDATLTQHVCLVDRIRDKRISSETGQTEYLISWQGFDPQGNEFEDTWEPESNVLGEELVEEFERSLARQRSFQQKRATSVSGSKGQSRDPSHHWSREENSYPSDLSHHPPHPYPPSLFSLSRFSSFLGHRRPIYGRPGGGTALKRKASGLEDGNQRINKENIHANQPVNGGSKGDLPTEKVIKSFWQTSLNAVELTLHM